MNAVAAQIEVGRRVRFHLPYGDTPEGLIVAIHGELKGRQANPGPMQIIRDGDATFDIITFDGRRFAGKREHDVGRMGIGRIDLLDRVHGPAMIERAHHWVAERIAADQLAAITARDDFQAAEAARVIVDAPVFYWNGIKDAKGGKLTLVWYSMGPLVSNPEPGIITITARDYGRFSDKVRACFAVTNDSDSMTDYFDNDRIRVLPCHPLYPKVKAALEARQAHYDQASAKRAARKAGGAA